MIRLSAKKGTSWILLPQRIDLSKCLSIVEQFKNPPIQEALLDIQVALPGDVTLETLKNSTLDWKPAIQKVRSASHSSKDFRFRVRAKPTR